MWVDTKDLDIEGGDGGDGAVSFRREKGIARGGPDGGRGGRGGSVIVVAEKGTRLLNHLASKRTFKAERGGNGSGGNRTGANGSDCVIKVPPGTLILDIETGEVLADLVEPGDSVVAAAGGKGGRGNSSFATPARRAPRFRERGAMGEKRRIRLELRMIADIGLVGFPNAGKSTLLSRISAASPKAAPYPFTTLHPVLGTVEVPPGFSYTALDLPGIIEEAHLGRGLGIDFLRHISRARSFWILIDINEDDPSAALSILLSEMKAFDEDLTGRPRVILLSKADTMNPEEVGRAVRVLEERGETAFAISAVTGLGIDGLVRRGAEMVRELPAPEPMPATAYYGYERAAEIIPEDGNSFRVDSRALEEFLDRWDPEQMEILGRFWKILEREGIVGRLKEAGMRAGSIVRIGPWEFEYMEEDG